MIHWPWTLPWTCALYLKWNNKNKVKWGRIVIFTKSLFLLILPKQQRHWYIVSDSKLLFVVCCYDLTIYNSSRKTSYQKISELCSNFNIMSDKSKFYYLFTTEDLSIINIFGKCIIECLETRKLKQGLWYWNIFSLSVYIINFF